MSVTILLMAKTKDKKSEQVWILDIDGVITDPKLKKVIYPEILTIIVKRLINNYLVAFNTGRSEKWLDERVLGLLRKLLKKEVGNLSPLSNLVNLCEMGSIIVEFDDSGKMIKRVLNKNVIPTVLKNTIKDMVSEVYSESMFVDETKEVILTIEMKDGFSYEEYEIRQAEFREEIGIIMANYHPHLQVGPSSTTIAIDVKPIGAGKGWGLKKLSSGVSCAIFS